MMPSCFLIFTILVHGFLGSYLEMAIGTLGKIAVPIMHFANSSISAHYGTSFGESFMIQGFTITQNLGLAACILSAIFFLPMMDSWGRKFCTIYFAPGIFLVGCLSWIIGYYVNSIEITLLGSICLGIGTPIKLGISRLYIAECAPDEIRGFSVMSVIIISTITGMLFQFLSLEQVFGTDTKWTMLFIIIGIVLIVYMCIGSLIPESPKFMKMKNQDEKKIMKTIKLFHGESVDPTTVIDKFEKEILLTKSSTYDIKKIFSDPTSFDSLKLVFIAALVPALGVYRIMVVDSVLLKIRYGFSNADAVLFDSIVSVVCIPLNFLIPIIIEKIGRRPVIIFNVLINFTAAILLFIAQIVFELFGSNIITVTLSGCFSVIYYLTTAMGIGSFDILLIADLLPVGSKSAVSKIVLVSANSLSIITNLYFSFLDPILGSFVHIPLIIFQLFFLFYFWKHLPETKQKSVNENFEKLRSRVNSCRTSRRPTLEVSKPEYGTFT